MAEEQAELDAIAQLNTATNAISAALTQIAANLQAAIDAAVAANANKVSQTVLDATNAAVTQLQAVATAATALASQGAANPVPQPVPVVPPAQ